MRSFVSSWRLLWSRLNVDFAAWRKRRRRENERRAWRQSQYAACAFERLESRLMLFGGEIGVAIGGVNIPDNSGTLAFGETTVGEPVQKTIRISNSDSLWGLGIGTMSPPTGFSISGAPMMVNANSYADVTITMLATAPGSLNTQLSFSTSDSDENPYNFALTGQVNPVTVSIAATDGTATEGLYADGAAHGQMTVTRTGPTTNSLDVYFSIGGSASGGDRSVSPGTMVTIASGQSSATIDVWATPDNLVESSETVVVTLSSSQYFALGTSQATVTIADDPVVVSLTTLDGLAYENGSNTGGFKLTREGGDTTQALTVGWTIGGTATYAGDYSVSDLAGTTGYQFAANETEKTFTVTGAADSSVEGTEDMTVTLNAPSSPAAYVLGDDFVAIDILDDDHTPTIVITDATVPEGENAVFGVFLSDASANTITVNFATANGSATAGVDYTSNSGMLTFSPGDTWKTISVTTLEDADEVPVEDFFVNLSSPTSSPGGSATIADGTGDGLILDVTRTPEVSVATLPKVTEGYAGIAFVHLDAPSGRTVSVKLSTEEDVALDGPDFAGIAEQVIVFAPGEMVKAVAIGTVADGVKEEDEPFWVLIADPVNAGLGNNYDSITITEDPGHETFMVCDCGCGCPNVQNSQNPDAGVSTHSDAHDRAIVSGAKSNPHPIVVADTPLPAIALSAETIEARLTFGGVEGDTIYYSTSGIDPGESVRFAMQASTALATGRYRWEIALTFHFADGTEIEHTLAGYQSVVNLNDSPFGVRGTLKYLDRLVIQEDGVLLVKGNTDTIWFQEDGTDFIGQDGDPDGATLVQNIDDTFTHITRDGIVRAFSALGLLLSITDRNGNQTQFVYDDMDEDEVEDELVEVILPGGDTIEFGYTDGLDTSITDAAGTTLYDYDEERRLIRITRPDPDGEGPRAAPETEFGYDEGTNLVTSMSRNGGAATIYEFDAFRTLIGQTNPNETEKELSAVLAQGLVDTSGSLGSQGNPAPLLKTADAVGSRTNELGETETFTTDRYGYYTSVTDALGNTTTFERDIHGRVTRVIGPDPDGEGELEAPETEYTYDERGNVTLITFADLTTQAFAYHATLNVLTSFTDELGRVTLYDLDENGNVTEIRRVVGEVDDEINEETDDVVVTLTYTAPPEDPGDPPAGLVETITDPLGRLTEFSHNARGQVTLVTFAVGTADEATVEFEYDAAGNRTAVVDELGRRTEYTFDALGQVVSVTGPDPDGEGEQESPVWLYVRNAMSAVTQATDPLGRESSFTYGAFGKMTSATAPDPDGEGPLDPPVTAWAYNAAGWLISETDALGRVVAYAYDDAGRVIAVTLPDPDGEGELAAPVTELEYDNFGRLVAETDALGNVTLYAYDARNRLISVTQADPDGEGELEAPVTEYAWDAAGQLVSVTDPLGRVVSYQYDELGRVVLVIHPDPDGEGELEAPETAYAYDKVGNLRFVVDALGNTTEYQYDHRDRLVLIIGADPDDAGPLASPETAYAYTAAGELSTVTDALGRVTSYTRDGLGRVVEITLPDPDGGGPLEAPVLGYTYDLVGNRLTETDPLGNVTLYAFDDLDRLLSVTRPDPDDEGPLTSPVTLYAWDAAGQLAALTDPLGRTTEYSHDLLGRVIAVTLPDPDGEGELESPVYGYAFDAVGNLIEESDPLGNVTVYAFDNLYRLLTVTQPDPDGEGPLDAPVTTFTHDAVGNRTSLTDPVGNTTVWVFDGLDRIIEETNELEDTRYFAYDAVGNVIEKIDRNERVTEFLYDNLHRRIEENWLDGQTVVRTIAYEWDAAGQLLSVDDVDADYEYSYDNLGQVVEMMADVGSIVVLTQGFDAVGNRTSLTAEIDSVDDFLNEYTFDALGRNTRIEQSGQGGGNSVAEKRVDFSYFADGQLAAIARYKDLDGGSGNLVAESEFGYDGMGRLADLTHSDGVTVINAYAWAYDANSRVTQVESVDGTSDYIYDHTGQVIDVDHSYQADEEFSFDGNGNRTMAGYVFGDNNQLLSDGTWDYLYDGEGNTVRKTRISEDPADDHRIDYEWDHRNRLMSVLFRDNDNVATKAFLYFYDYLDRRTAKIIDYDGPGEGAAEEERFIYDGAHVVLILDGAGDVKNRVLYASGVGQVLADEATGRGVLWLLTDNQGTVRDEVDNAGDLVNHRQYSTFGQITDETDPTGTIFAFAGGLLDAETGQQYHWHRYYSVDVGYWLSEDPIGFAAGDTKLNRYVGNDPGNWTDGDGLAKKHSGPTSGETPAAATGRDAHKAFPAATGHDPGVTLPSGLKTDGVKETVEAIVIPELKPVSRVQPNGTLGGGKYNAAMKQVGNYGNDMPNPKGKSIIVELWGYTCDTATNRFTFLKLASKKLVKHAPVVGTFFAGWFWASDVDAKGAVGGTANSILDAIPAIGSVKGVGEMFVGDFIVDKDHPHYGKDHVELMRELWEDHPELCAGMPF